MTFSPAACGYQKWTHTGDCGSRTMSPFMRIYVANIVFAGIWFLAGHYNRPKIVIHWLGHPNRCSIRGRTAYRDWIREGTGGAPPVLYDLPSECTGYLLSVKTMNLFSLTMHRRYQFLWNTKQLSDLKIICIKLNKYMKHWWSLQKATMRRYHPDF